MSKRRAKDQYVYGRHAVEALLRAQPLSVKEIWLTEGLSAERAAVFTGLTVLLIVLMRIRWVRHRTLYRCVALSVYAHLVLGLRRGDPASEAAPP